MSGLSSSFESDESMDIQQLADLNKKLSQQNEQYVESLASLKMDYQQALGFVEKNESLQRENNSLKQSLHETKAKLDDLQKRFDFLLLKQAEEAKNNKYNAQGGFSLSIVLQKQKQLEENLNSTINELEKMKQENQNLTNLLNSEKNNNQKCVEKLLIASKSYFGYDFTTFSSVLEALTTKKEIPVEQPKEIVQDEKSLQQLQKYKNKNYELKKIIFDLDMKVKELENDLDMANITMHDAKEKIRNQEDEFKHQSELNKLRTEKEIKIYTDQIQSLKARIERLNQQIINLQTQKSEPRIDDIPEPKEGRCKQERINELERDLENERIKSNNLAIRIAELETKQKLMKNQRRDKPDKNESLSSLIQSENDKLHREIETLKTEKETLLAEVRAAHASYNQAKIASETSETSRKLALKALQKLSEDMEANKKEIIDLREQREKLMILLQKQNYLLSKFKEKANEQNASQQEKTIVKLIKEEIPATAFYCADFPRELCQSIAIVSQCKEMNDASKLRRVLQIIAAYYLQKISNLESQISKASDDAKDLQNCLSDFVNAAEEVLNTKISCPNDLIESITKIIDELSDNKYRADINEDRIAKISERLGNPDIEAEINELFSVLEKTANSLNINRKKLAKSREENQDLLKKLEMQENAQERKDKAMESKLSLIEAQLKLEKEKSFALEKLIETERIKCSDKKREINDIIDEKSDEYVNEISNLKKKYEDDINGLLKQQTSLSDKIDELSNENTILVTKLLNTENMVDTLKKTIASLNAQIDDMKLNYEIEITEMQNKAKSDKAADKQKWDEVLEESRRKFKELSELHNKSMNALLESERRHSSEKERRVDLENEIDFCKKEINSLKDTIRSHNMIIEAKEKAMKVAHEMSVEEAIRNERVKCDESVNKLITFFARNFTDFFDISCPMNNESYMTAVVNASKEVDRLRKSDFRVRSLLGCNDDDNIEDFVSKLLLSYVPRS